MVVTVAFPYLRGGDCSLPLPTWWRLQPFPTYMMMNVAFPYLRGGDCSLPIRT